MNGRLARLWHLATPTDDAERRAAAERTEQQQAEVEAEVAHHRFHRERNHFADRISAAFREDARWN